VGGVVAGGLAHVGVDAVEVEVAGVGAEVRKVVHVAAIGARSALAAKVKALHRVHRHLVVALLRAALHVVVAAVHAAVAAVVRGLVLVGVVHLVTRLLRRHQAHVLKPWGL